MNNLKVVPSDSEIESEYDTACEAATGETKWPGMSYEQGVQDTLRWILGEDDLAPITGEE